MPWCGLWLLHIFNTFILTVCLWDAEELLFAFYKQKTETLREKAGRPSSSRHTSGNLLRKLSCPESRNLVHLGFLLPLVPAQGSARCGFMYHTLITPLGLFADLACFVDGGKVLKTKRAMKSPVRGPMASVLFFDGLQRMMWILCLMVGAKPVLRSLERNQTVTVPVAGRGKTTMAS